MEMKHFKMVILPVAEIEWECVGVMETSHLHLQKFVRLKKTNILTCSVEFHIPTHLL